MSVHGATEGQKSSWTKLHSISFTSAEDSNVIWQYFRH